MTHDTTSSANTAQPIPQQISVLQDLAAANYLRLSALQRLTAIARDAGEAYPISGGEISATLEPLADDLCNFFELLESLLQRVEAEAVKDSAERVPYMLRCIYGTYQAVRLGLGNLESRTFEDRGQAEAWATNGKENAECVPCIVRAYDWQPLSDQYFTWQAARWGKYTVEYKDFKPEQLDQAEAWARGGAK